MNSGGVSYWLCVGGVAWPPMIGKVVLDVMNELDRAARKHPKWPVSVLHQVAIVQEEMGEVQKEALELFELFEGIDGTGPDIQDVSEAHARDARLTTEMTQVAAMAIRFLLERRMKNDAAVGSTSSC